VCVSERERERESVCDRENPGVLEASKIAGLPESCLDRKVDVRLPGTEAVYGVELKSAAHRGKSLLGGFGGFGCETGAAWPRTALPRSFKPDFVGFRNRFFGMKTDFWGLQNRFWGFWV